MLYSTPMNKRYIFGSIGALILIILAAFVVWKVEKHPKPMSSQTLSVASMTHLPKEIIILLTKNGFTPNQVTVNIGTAVRWKNESGNVETVNSDNYPTNKLHKELNFGTFSNNFSVIYIFTKAGIYGYHNQFHHEQKGEIIVTQ